ncbi:MAG: LysR family transcriptional regulator [Gammaproteobacteria bacterium]|nr:LysR family transcriptional regulator [Gammaproteobacteria bacterium]
MDRLDAMRIFVQVAELASFTRAAEVLGMPKANVSTAVQQLEAQLGARLLHRTTRKVQTTQDGMAFYERCRDLLADVGDIESMFQRGAAHVTGRIRVDMSSGIAKNLVIPKLPEFLARHPGIEVELSSIDRRVDLVHEGFDCVIRVGKLADSGLIAKRLGQFTIINCASPKYLKQYGRPRKLGDLENHRLIHYVPILGTKPDGFEHFDGQRYATVEMQGVVTVNNSDAYLAGCLAELGIIQVPSVGVKSHLKDRRLIEILPKYRAEPMPVSLVYPHRRNVARRVQLFMAWIEQIMTTYVS